MTMVNSYDPARGVELDEADRELLRRRDTVMGAAYRLFYERPVHVVSAHGTTLVDRDGHEYLDAYNNVPVVGHANERVRRAVDRQLATLNTHTRYLTDDVVTYAERLTALFPPPLDQVTFTCTGSEAVDLALRVARAATGRRGVVVTRHAYHGTTSACAEVSPSFGPGNPVPDHVALVDAPDSVRDDPAGAAERFGRRLDDAVAELGARGYGVAAVLLDSVFASDGLQVQPEGLLRAASETARRHGALHVADEVQGGFGRVGTHWWAFERHGVVPDLVALGKPMGNGIPIAGVVGRAELFDAFGGRVRYFNTFGGNPVSVAAASAVLDELEDRDLLAHAEALGGRVATGLREVTTDEPGVAEVRRAGLFLAVELVEEDGSPDAARAAAVVNAMRERRILISASGTYDNVLKIRPPLVLDESSADRLVHGLGSSIGGTRRQVGVAS